MQISSHPSVLLPRWHSLLTMHFCSLLAEDFLAGEQSSNLWEDTFNQMNKTMEIIISLT